MAFDLCCVVIAEARQARQLCIPVLVPSCHSLSLVLFFFVHTILSDLTHALIISMFANFTVLHTFSLCICAHG